MCKGFFGRSIFAGFSRSLFAPGLKIRGFHVPSSFGTWIWLQRSVCPILAKLGSCHSTVKKTKEKIVLATPLREVSFSYPPFPHMGNTEIAQKRKERRIKKRKEIIITSCMYMATPIHGSNLSKCMSVCPVPCS